MKNEWIGPKIIIGNTATGNYYYPRPIIIIQIWDEIEKGNNVLIAAPRRVGKSSIMLEMVNNSPAGYKCIFENVQGIRSEAQFYKRFYELIITCLNSFEKTTNWFREFWKEHKIEEISIDGKIKLRDGAIDYLEEINNLLPKLNNKEIKIVLFIDELPEVLHKLYKENKTAEASSILENIRRWRQEDQFKKNLRLVLAGSIGIQYVVKMVQGRTTDINDFNAIKFEALNALESIEYIKWATENNATIQYNKGLVEYLLGKVQYYVPYFINIMLDEINKTARKNNVLQITKSDIDKAFDSVVKSNDHFKDWKSRLFDYMPADEANFLNHVLMHISHKDVISQQKIFDLAGKYNLVNDRMDLIDGLEKDGYITEQSEKYIFLSPFLKAFWKRNNPIYND